MNREERDAAIEKVLQGATPQPHVPYSNYSLYERVVFQEGGSTLVERFKEYTSHITKEVVFTSYEGEILRWECYCCSCEDGSDAFCRNHNIGYGTRPCDVHKTKGYNIVDIDLATGEETDTGEMPDSVQVHLAKIRAAHA